LSAAGSLDAILLHLLIPVAGDRSRFDFYYKVIEITGGMFMSSSLRNYGALCITLLIGTLALVTSISVYAQAAPVAKLTTVLPLPASAPPPFSVTFNGLDSTCVSPCKAHFDFGDGNTQDIAAGNAFLGSDTYLIGGTYTATMTITDGNGKKASASLTVNITKGQTLASYLNDCEQQLGFQDSNIPTNLSCNNAVLFAPNSIEGTTLATGLVNDAVGYARITDNVDLAFACRWLTNDTLSSTDGSVIFVPPFVKAQSVEMIIHNRQSGNTCFFEAAPQTLKTSNGGTVSQVPVALVSPAVAARAAPNTTQAKFWYEPLALDNTLQCVDCHIAGPYISTPRISAALGQFGLLNNGHDTFGRYPSGNNNVGKYHAVGTTLAHFNDLALNNNVISANTCASGCHSLGEKGAVDDVFGAGKVQQLLPSITHVIDDAGNQRPSISVTTSGVMPPFYDDLSNYHWANLDTPGDGTESENFAGAMNHVANSIIPVMFSGYDASHPDANFNPECTQPGPNNVPAQMDAHVVGVPNDYAFSTNTMALIADRLRTFNLKEGLVCLNSDQDQGHSCHDYTIRYLCSVNNQDGTPIWSNWYSHPIASDGDHEERYRDNNICGGATPIAIQAQFYAGGTSMYVMGPNDRLARFSPYGLTCNSVDQVDNQCSNYVVRYDYCSLPPPTHHNKTLTNVYAVGKQVTSASGSLAKGQSHNGGTTQQWNTQQWDIEPVVNTEYVRLHNVPTNVYLTVTSTAEQATVGTAAFDTSTNEMWTIETINGSSAFRLKNLSSGKYLTIADPKNFTSTPDYLPIYSQGLNTGWTSQYWIIQ